MTTLRLTVAWVLSVAGYGLAQLAVWIAGIREVDPTVEALRELRDRIQDIPTLDLDQPACVLRTAVLAAIGQAITDAER